MKKLLLALALLCSAAWGESVVMLWGVGENGNGQLGDGTLNPISVPKQIKYADSITPIVVKDVAMGYGTSMVVTDNGTVWRSGWQINAPLTFSQVQGLSNVSSVGCLPVNNYYRWTTILKADGTARSVDMTNGTGSSWSDANGIMTGIKKIGSYGSGAEFRVALKTDGTVWCQNNVVPPRPGYLVNIGLTDVADVSAGSNFGVAVKTDGTVWAWGYGNSGQLGNGTSTVTFQTVPSVVKTDASTNLTGGLSVACGSEHVVLVRTDGTVWTWGRWFEHQLGRTLTVYTDCAYAGIVTTPTGAIKAYANVYISTVVKTNGKIVCWGDMHDDLFRWEYDFGAVPVYLSMSDGRNFLAGLTTDVPSVTLTSASPATGLVVGGETVTLTGTNLDACTGVYFDGFPGTNIVKIGSDTVTVKTPAHGIGAADIKITSLINVSTLPGGFTYGCNVYGAQGPAGPQGIQGLKGDSGAQGVKGDKGDVGDIGSAGPAGVAGAKGDKGDVGEVGPQGLAGLDGAGGQDGVQGPAGPQGSKGDKGERGDKGDLGLLGPQGPAGEDGSTGILTTQVSSELPVGSIIQLDASVEPPVGYRLLGSQNMRLLNGRKYVKLTVNFYRKE